MSEPTRKLLEEALNLPIHERAVVAAELLASLDGEPDVDVEAAWADEIERRIRRVRAGQGEFQSWDEVVRDLRPRR
ncbi:MAG: addiction module protein [Myxococcales bacterium]|nr:addiction module protein [Myxococcales bacterium]MCB9535142.1 addiction module protein [Myxococcales bacterium]